MEYKTADELLDATIEILKDKKITSKAKADVDKRVLDASGGCKSNWKLVSKCYAEKGRAWIGTPLVLNTEDKKKDSLAASLNKLVATIKALEEFNMAEDFLADYLNPLEEIGISIKIDHDKFDHVDTETDLDLEENLQSAKAYLKTLEEYDDTIKEEHAAAAEMLNFAPSKDYVKVVNIYKKGLSGKEIDDDVQDILTHNELLDTAVNLVSEKAKQINAQSDSE